MPETIDISLSITARDLRAIAYQHGHAGQASPEFAKTYLRSCLGMELDALELMLQHAESEDPNGGKN